jgi:prepilin-type N-terminal cleavage/methylation domain-containing protein
VISAECASSETRQRFACNKGFTLPEVLIATAILATLVSSILVYFRNLTTDQAASERRLSYLEVSEIVENYAARRMVNESCSSVLGYTKFGGSVGTPLSAANVLIELGTSQSIPGIPVEPGSTQMVAARGRCVQQYWATHTKPPLADDSYSMTGLNDTTIYYCLKLSAINPDLVPLKSILRSDLVLVEVTHTFMNVFQGLPTSCLDATVLASPVSPPVPPIPSGHKEDSAVAINYTLYWREGAQGQRIYRQHSEFFYAPNASTQ